MQPAGTHNVSSNSPSTAVTDSSTTTATSWRPTFKLTSITPPKSLPNFLRRTVCDWEMEGSGWLQSENARRSFGDGMGCCSGSYGKCEFLKSEGRDRARGRPGAGGRVGSACGERVPGGSCPPVPRSSPQAKFWDHTPERRYSPGAGRASLAARAPPVPARAPGAHAPVRTPPPGPLVLQLLQLLLAFLSRACGMMLLANLISKCFGYPFSTRTHPIKSQTSPLDRNRSPPMRFNGGRSSSYYPAPLRKLKIKIKCGIYGKLI